LTVWTGAARRCLAGASIAPKAWVRLPDEADKLFNWVGIERRFVSTDRFHQPASSLVNGSFRPATAAQPNTEESPTTLTIV
jgi:hypothetical protein